MKQNKFCTISFCPVNYEAMVDDALCTITCWDRKFRATSPQSFTLWQQVTMEVTRWDHSRSQHYRKYIQPFTRRKSIVICHSPRSLYYCLFDWQLRDCFLHGEVASAGASSDVYSAGWPVAAAWAVIAQAKLFLQSSFCKNNKKTVRFTYHSALSSEWCIKPKFFFVLCDKQTAVTYM